MNDQSLGSLMNFVGSKYIFSDDNYPVLRHMSPTERHTFVIGHLVHHMNKSIGTLSAQCESAEHGGNIDTEATVEATSKLLVNILKLAESLGLNGSELADLVPKVMKSK